MRKRERRDSFSPRLRRAVLLGTAAFLAAGCATSGYNRGQYNLLSIKQEAEWGAQLKTEVDRELAARKMDYHDPVVSAYVERLGQKLVAAAPEVNFEYTFTVVKTEVVNAFALPGGHIYVHTGLIAECDDEAELAGVLAHEIGHVVGRHSSERLSALLTAVFVGQLLISLPQGELEAYLAQLAVEIVTTSGALAYSRQQENEADEFAVQNLYDAGYDPRALQRFFRKLRDKEGDVSRLEVFFSTHPDPADRRSRVRDKIEELPPRGDALRDTPEFQQVKQICQKLHPPTPLAEPETN